MAQAKVDASFRYGCWNANRRPGYMAKDGLVVETKRINGEVVNAASYKMRYIDDGMSIDCRYDFKTTDGACEGCKQRDDR